MVLYDNYLKYFDKTPEQQYREDMQQFVIESWENNVLLDDIILEDEPRTFVYDNNNEQEVIIDSVAEISTNLAKIEGNYISVLFKDCNFEYNRGSMFYRPSEKSYYLVYQSTNAMRTTAKCKAIQCNNIIKWVDIPTKKIMAYPCSMGQELSSTTSQDLKFISVANGRTVVIVFGNEFTRRLELNQRLIFNGVPYRINAIKNYEENNYIDRSVDLLFLYLEKSSEEPDDDFIYDIANFENKYVITTDINKIVGNKGDKGKINAILTYDGVEVNDVKFEWSSSDESAVVVDKDGNYEIVGDIESDAKIVCSYYNGVATTEIDISIRDANVGITNPSPMNYIEEDDKYSAYAISSDPIIEYERETSSWIYWDNNININTNFVLKFWFTVGTMSQNVLRLYNNDNNYINIKLKRSLVGDYAEISTSEGVIANSEYVEHRDNGLNKYFLWLKVVENNWDVRLVTLEEIETALEWNSNDNVGYNFTTDLVWEDEQFEDETPNPEHFDNNINGFNKVIVGNAVCRMLEITNNIEVPYSTTLDYWDNQMILRCKFNQTTGNSFDVAEIRTIPNEDYIEISKNSYKNIETYLYVNNIKQDDEDITYSCNFENECYSIVEIDNGIKVICHKPTTEKLEITFFNETYSLSKVITIKLKGVW